MVKRTTILWAGGLLGLALVLGIAAVVVFPPPPRPGGAPGRRYVHLQSRRGSFSQRARGGALRFGLCSESDDYNILVCLSHQ